MTGHAITVLTVVLHLAESWVTTLFLLPNKGNSVCYDWILQMKWYAREVLVCIWFVCFRQCSWLLSHFAVCKEDRPTVHPCFLSDDLACSVWPCVSTPPTAAVHHVPHCDLSLTIIHCGWLFGDPVEILRLLCIKSYTVGFPVPVVFKLILLVNCLIICVVHDKLLVDLFFFSCTYLYMCSGGVGDRLGA